MGSSRVKKTAVEYVTRKDFNDFMLLVNDFIHVVDKSLQNLEAKSVPTKPPIMISTPPTNMLKCFNHLVYDSNVGKCKNCAPTPTPTIAKDRNFKTLQAVKYALRLMKDIRFDVSDTSFTVIMRSLNYNRLFTINAYNGPQFFVDVKYVDVNGIPRSAGYNTLQTATADITAIVMYYAMKHS